MTLLLIDDDMMSIAPLLRALENHAHEPLVHFHSGKQAIEHLQSGVQSNPFSLACVSLSLKDMHGYALCTYLQRHPLCANTPIIALSDNDNQPNVNHLTTLGISDLLTRPFNAPHTSLRVAMALRLAKETRHRIQCERKLAGDGEADLEAAAESLLHPLSSLPNRIALQHYVRQFNHTNAVPLSFIALGVDSYEEYLGYYGYQQANHLCRTLAQTIATLDAPLGSALCQYDAHVFVIMMPSTPLDEAVRLANRIRHQIGDLAIPHRESHSADIVTLSAGLGKTEDTAYTPVNALAVAFVNMERAMRNGGNHALSSVGYL